MQDYYTPKGKQLTLTRRMIDRWLKEGQSNREIARRLAKAPQTFTTKSNVGKLDNKYVRGNMKRFTLLTSLKKPIKTIVNVLLSRSP
ncbi:hypothetical protein ScFU97_07750 [Streptococcus canis]|nr:hypothetical protein ScFU97_07750 [Streptococcus canis]GMX36529.1 hypothetical protein SpKU43_16080 [Streptococcus canis]GMX39963.1 hypothetical protein ScKU71_11860 [Streptococcus canis]